MTDFVTPSYFVLASLLGSIIYVILPTPPQVYELKPILRHLALGAIAGFLIFLSGYIAPTKEGYLAAIGVGFGAIEFIKTILHIKNGNSNGESSGGIPL